MSPMRTVLREGKTFWLQQFAARRIRRQPDTPLISFSFDDVPFSAYANGLPLLASFRVRATFYVCLGIDSAQQKHLGPVEIKQLHRAGHEIGCHTFSHYRLSHGTAQDLAADAARNRIELASMGIEPQSFSFPFGELSFPAKQKLAPNYQTLRSTRIGINGSTVDLNCLKAVPLYEDRITTESIRAWLDRAEAERGWLIFYTHGVTERPGEYDISPQTFAKVLALCSGRGWPILPVGAAGAIAAHKQV